MFARLSAAVLLALPLLALADCESKNQYCCNSVQNADTKSGAAIIGNLIGAAAQGITGHVGVTCTPLSVLALSGTSCNQQTVCCSHNNFNGLVNVGCTPINLNL